MKKTVKALALILTLIMSISVFSVFSVLAEGEEAVLPTAPTVTEEEKEDRKYYFHEDFSTVTTETLNISPKPTAVKAANGFWLCNENNREFAVKNGYLYMNGADYIDLQFHHLGDAYSCKESFVWSVKFMPLSENITGEIVEFVRRDSSADKWNEKVLKIKDGHILFKGEDIGKVELNKWILIEIAFGYNETEKLFDKYTVMINGVEIGGGELHEDLLLTQIKHFRTFRSMTNYQYAVDNVNIIAGTKSILYAKDYTAPVETPDEPGAPTEPSNPGSGGATGSGNNENTGSNNNGSNTTEKPETSKPKDTTVKDTSNDATTGSDEGCASLVSGGAVTLLIAIGTGCAVAFRKKKD